MDEQIYSLKKHLTKRLTVENLKILLDGLPPKSTIRFYDEKMIIITKTRPPKYYTIFNNGYVKS